MNTQTPLSLADIHTLAATCPYRFDTPNHNDLVGIGGDLQPATLLAAYLQGVFPWFNEGEAIAWWRPDPRCVMHTATYRPKKSLIRTAKKYAHWHISYNHAFDAVMYACSQPRHYSSETWINAQMMASYQILHRMGIGFSIEVWADDVGGELIGGLYGLKIGSGIFGESMFHRRTDASKLAFWALVALCRTSNIPIIDCQLPNDYLIGLGASTLPLDCYMAQLAALTCPTASDPNWHQLPSHSLAQLID